MRSPPAPLFEVTLLQSRHSRKMKTQRPFWAECKNMAGKLITVLVAVGAVGYLGWNGMSMSANESSLEATENAENRVSLAVYGMT